MIVLGLDPGTTERNPTGWAVVETRRDTVLHYGVLKPQTDEHIADLACQLFALLGRLTLGGMPEAPRRVQRIAIESPWIGNNPRTGITLALLTGAYLGVAALAGIEAKLIQPSEGKRAIVDGRATKSEMRQAVRLRYDAVVPSHVADAIGVAMASITWEERNL